MIFIEQLKSKKMWVNWKGERRDGKLTKIPKSPKNGKSAMSNNPQTWGTFKQAVKACDTFNLDGLGFVFSDGICGIDIDGDNDHTEENSLAAEILELFKGTYEEKSPSGKGYHIIFRCDLNRVPTEGKRLKSNYYCKNPKNGLEIYFSGLTNRFFTFTGECISQTEDITDQTENVLIFLNKYMRRETTNKFESVFERARHAKDSKKFIALFDRGDISAYGNDDSAADMALCTLLAFYLQGDKEDIDTAFRQSALYRDKWERQDYREITIEKAINLCGGVFYRSAGRPRKQDSETDEKPFLTPENLAEYLENENISIRLNCITRRQEIQGVEGESLEHGKL